MRQGYAFTLIELLSVIAIIVVLATVLFPVFARAKDAAKRTGCLSNLRQIGVGMALYDADSDDRMPDRRDLKRSLPGGYRPWISWPPSDPRSGWAADVLRPYATSNGLWSCAGVEATALNKAVQVVQDSPIGMARYWMWRFDHIDEPVPLDNWWGKTPDIAVADYSEAQGKEFGVAELELAVDPYFPRSARNVPTALAGLSAHSGGMTRLFLDLHARWSRDVRLNP